MMWNKLRQVPLQTILFHCFLYELCTFSSIATPRFFFLHTNAHNDIFFRRISFCHFYHKTKKNGEFQIHKNYGRISHFKAFCGILKTMHKRPHFWSRRYSSCSAISVFCVSAFLFYQFSVFFFFNGKNNEAFFAVGTEH